MHGNPKPTVPSLPASSYFMITHGFSPPSSTLQVKRSPFIAHGISELLHDIHMVCGMCSSRGSSLKAHAFSWAQHFDTKKIFLVPISIKLTQTQLYPR